jgi:hypothetical protein
MSDAITAEQEQGLTLEQRRRFLALPLEERRRQMAEQAACMAFHYESAAEMKEREKWQGGCFV